MRHLSLVEIHLRLCLTSGFTDHRLISCQRRKGRKLRCPLGGGESGAVGRHGMRQVQQVFVFFVHCTPLLSVAAHLTIALAGGGSLLIVHSF